MIVAQCTANRVNVAAAFELSRFAHPLLTRHAVSSIVNVGSVSGLTHVRTGAPYGMSKAALHQLTKNLACEWADSNVRVNTVAPGGIASSGFDTYPDEAKAKILEFTDVVPLGRFGSESEISAAIV